MVAILIDIAYVLGLIALSPVWLYRMLRYGRYRGSLGERFGKAPQRHGLQPVIWIHAVSLGEVNGIKSLVAELSSQLPDYQIVISSTTDTGMTQARKLFEPDRRVFLFPMDFSFVVRRAFHRLRPNLVVLMEGEAWPNFLRQANGMGIPVMIVNGRIGENKGYPRYKLVKPLVKRLLFSRLASVGAQEQAYAERFIELGADASRVHVTGSLKFDTAVIMDKVEGSETLAAAVGLREGDKLIVAGGTGEGEERPLLEMFGAMTRRKKFPPHTRLAIVPRKPERFNEVARLIRQAGFVLVRRSERKDGAASIATPDAVILGDTMGELRKFYSLASAIFVGRSLVPMGGSDMIEAAGLGKPVAFGPHVFNFPQARILVDAGVARQVPTAQELGEVLNGWLQDPAAAAAMGRRAQEVIRNEQGATQRNVELICDVLGRVPAERPGSIATVKLPR